MNGAEKPRIQAGTEERDTWMPVNQARQLIQVGHPRMKQLIAEGHFGVKHVPGSKLRLRRADVLRFLDACVSPAVNGPEMKGGDG